MSDNVDVLLVGVGNMGIEYAKVLDALNNSYLAIGRSEQGTRNFSEITKHDAMPGGFACAIDDIPSMPLNAIIAVSVEELMDTTLKCIGRGIKNILLEKPGGLWIDDIKKIEDAAKENDVKVFLAYNRRFYASTKKAQELIEEDGGVKSFNFEFTEWSNDIETLDVKDSVKEQWIYANSSHVIDLAFFLGGKPEKMSSFSAGSLEWHKKASVYSGAGISEKGALFSYQANWGAPGRWSVEILTSKRRFYFKPMEELNVQKLHSVKVEKTEIDDELDRRFKPGLYEEVKAFLFNQSDIRLKTVEEQVSDWTIIEKIESGTGV